MTNAQRSGGAEAASLAGCRVMVSAGPTHEAIDPVRYIANASSGKMGYAIARACQRAGADVVLISGPVSLEAPLGVELVRVVSAADMLKACQAQFVEAQVAILAAAVADYTPVRVADHKLKKSEGGLASLELKETADILQTLGRSKGSRVVVGFAAETSNLIKNARAKLVSKGCDLIVANDVSCADSTFGSDTNRVVFLSTKGVERLPLLTKNEVAERLVAKIAQLRAHKG